MKRIINTLIFNPVKNTSRIFYGLTILWLMLNYLMSCGF